MPPSPSEQPPSASRLLEGQHRRWRVAPPTDPHDGLALGDLPPVIAHLLYLRGIRSAAEAQQFLEAPETLFEDPRTLPDIHLAVQRLHEARHRDERVAVYGDFDADGVTGTALLVKALRRYGLEVIPYIPHRISEGHGLNRGAVDQLLQCGVQLITTVDCGITDRDPVHYARTRGIDVILTDHHLVAGELPDAVAVVNPHAPHSAYGFGHLTGVGMTLKLAQALLEPEAGAGWSDGLMELAAIGTVTDMAPLLGENRYILRHGIEQLRHTQSPGLQALIRAARVDPAHLAVEAIGFGIGPRLNAAGRLDRANSAYELLLTDDSTRGEVLAAELNAYNLQRQALTEETLTRCRELLPSKTPPLIFAGGADFNPGIAGLVAGKLADELGVPAVIYSVDGDRVLASCRSAPGFHWADALATCHDLLVRYGGHAQAAGFVCEPRMLSVLAERLEALAAERLATAPPATERLVDAEVELPQLMGQTLQVLRRMEPFGVGNPAPLFLTRGVWIERASSMGADGQHFRLKLRSGGAVWEAVAFRQTWVPKTTLADIIYTLDVDSWNGTPRLRLTIQDYIPRG